MATPQYRDRLRFSIAKRFLPSRISVTLETRRARAQTLRNATYEQRRVKGYADDLAVQSKLSETRRLSPMHSRWEMPIVWPSPLPPQRRFSVHRSLEWPWTSFSILHLMAETWPEPETTPQHSRLAPPGEIRLAGGDPL